MEHNNLQRIFLLKILHKINERFDKIVQKLCFRNFLVDEMAFDPEIREKTELVMDIPPHDYQWSV